MVDESLTVSFNEDVNELIDIVFEDYSFIDDFVNQMKKGDATLQFNRKILKKTIDESWVNTIEQGISELDFVIRNPSKDIKEEEEILPIELTRKITSRSIKHLTQLTNLINSIDKHGNVMPSKILNVYKEENYLTYENKFVNTLIDRLFIFLHKRLDILKDQADDELSNELKLDMSFQNKKTDVVIGLTISSKDKGDTEKSSNNDASHESKSLYERADNLLKIVTAFKSSPFAQKLGNNYVRPPIMRTNAIMKNQHLKQCLVLWQFIESYDKAGFEIDARQTAEKPPQEIMKSIYSLLALQYMLFRQSTAVTPDDNIVKKTRRTSRPVAPKIVREFNDELVEDYNYYEVENKKVLAVFPTKTNRKLTADEMNIRLEIDKALRSEKHFQAQQKKAARSKK